MAQLPGQHWTPPVVGPPLSAPPSAVRRLRPPPRGHCLLPFPQAVLEGFVGGNGSLESLERSGDVGA